MENLESSAKKLSLLMEPKLKLALEDYVHKGEAQVSAVGLGAIGAVHPCCLSVREFESERTGRELGVASPIDGDELDGESTGGSRPSWASPRRR